jgi:Glyoxalase-like domain
MGETVVMAAEFQVTFDSADPGAHASFWAEALHYVLQPPPPGFASWDAALDAWGVPADQRNDRSAIIDPAGVGPRVFFHRVPEPKTAKNRVHLDVRAAVGLAGEDRIAALEAECERLVGLGASRVQRFDADAASAGHIVMRDPEGNEFCLD